MTTTIEPNNERNRKFYRSPAFLWLAGAVLVPAVAALAVVMTLHITGHEPSEGTVISMGADGPAGGIIYLMQAGGEAGAETEK